MIFFCQKNNRTCTVIRDPRVDVWIDKEVLNPPCLKVFYGYPVPQSDYIYGIMSNVTFQIPALLEDYRNKDFPPIADLTKKIRKRNRS